MVMEANFYDISDILTPVSLKVDLNAFHVIIVRNSNLYSKLKLNFALAQCLIFLIEIGSRLIEFRLILWYLTFEFTYLFQCVACVKSTCISGHSTIESQCVLDFVKVQLNSIFFLGLLVSPIAPSL